MRNRSLSKKQLSPPTLGRVMSLEKIVSGGQTGVDRAALDAALAASFPCGGWCPAGRKAEDGVIPEKHPVVVWPGSGYRPRTLKNVRDSDGTLILFTRLLSTGTKLTRDLCVREKKPFLLLDASQVTVERAVSAVLQFIAEHSIAVMNVAGPRVSGWPEGYRFAFEVVGVCLRALPSRIGDRSHS
jgi:hypothetical protein